jgi:RIP metalloprotease RseP
VSETIPPGTPVPPDDDRPGEDVEVEVREPTALDRLGANPILRVAIVLVALGYAAAVSPWLFVLIMALLVSIFLHELGHFLVAKRTGMKVTEFFLGFGPRIWSFQRGETEYGMKIIPAGAYVKIVGMSNLEEVAPEDEARSYRAKGYWKRMPVVLAGPAVNIALGLLLFFVVFAAFGYTERDTQITSVMPGSAAAAAGIQPGDEIVSVNGERVGDFDDLSGVVRETGGTRVDVIVVRDGTEIIVPAEIGWGLADDVAHQLGLSEGDRITRVGDTDVATYDDVVEALAVSEGPVVLLVAAGGGEETVTVRSPLELPDDGAKGMLGVTSTPTQVDANPLQAAGQAVTELGTVVTGSVEGIGRLFSPSGIANLASLVANATDEAPDVVIEPARPVGALGSGTGADVAGDSSNPPPVDEDRPSSILGIIGIGTQVGELAGWSGVLLLLATVNIFLGLVNLIPLPPFDGGHIAVATYEAIRGRISRRPYRVDMAKLLPITYIVLVVMVGLFMSTLYLDVVDPVKIK